jgi:hypothetical protein
MSNEQILQSIQYIRKCIAGESQTQSPFVSERQASASRVERMEARILELTKELK